MQRISLNQLLRRQSTIFNQTKMATYQIQRHFPNYNNKLSKKQMIMTEPINLDSQSVQGQADGNQNFATRVYNDELNHWLEWIHKYDRKQTKIHPFSAQYFKQIYLPSVHRKFKLTVIFDNLMAISIKRKLKEPHFMKFSALVGAKVDINQIDLEEGSKNLYSQQKWINLLKIAQVLNFNKFIARLYYKQIQDFCNQQKSLEDQLNLFYQLSKQKGTQKISMSTWSKVVSIDCRQFWNEIIYEWPTLAPKSKIIQQIYSLFQSYLARKLENSKNRKLKQFLFSPKRKAPSDYLSEVADHLCLFTYPKKVKAVQDQLKTLKNKLKAYFQSANRMYKISKFENYGSFRSKMCLQTSDVDLTLFITNLNGDLIQSRQFVEEVIKKVFYCLSQFQRSKDQQLQIDNVYFVLHCKVPFIRLAFSNEMPLSSMDIVVNNENGVLNSAMLQGFSENKKIRNMALILKIWGKKNKLIDPQKLSSYGIVIMLLYFLMSSGYLSFPSLHQLVNRTFNRELHLKEDIDETLIKFFQFYERSSAYHENEVTACLIFGCSQHEKLYNPGFVINIHDPFDGTNPGRLKDRDKFTFFHTLDNTLAALQQAQTFSQVNKRQKLNTIFGFNYQQLQDSQQIVID